MRVRRALAAAVAALVLLSAPASGGTYAGCYAYPVGPNTPTGIAGCEVWGDGIASWYSSSGSGVAMNFCTWVRRHDTGCGSVSIYSYDTGVEVIARVVDFCDCYTGTSKQRIVDLQGGVVSALGLSRSAGLYSVRVLPSAGSPTVVIPAATPAPTPAPTPVEEPKPILLHWLRYDDFVR